MIGVVIACMCVWHIWLAFSACTCQTNPLPYLPHHVDKLCLTINDDVLLYFSGQHMIAVVRKVHDRQEQLMPNLLYVGLAGLAGSIVTRQRSILARIFWPPVFALATSLYVLPNTTRSALRLLRDTIDSPEFRKPIQEHAPVILDTTDATRSAVAQGATQATKLRYQLEESLSQQVARVRHEYNSLEGKVRNALSSGAASVSEQVQELTDKSSQAYRKATSEIRAHTKEITGWLGRAVPAGNHEKRLTSSEKVERTQEDISRLASHINARLHEEAKEAREKAEILARQVKREAQEAHEKANALARKVAEDVAHATEVAEKRAEKAEKSIRETIKQAPHAIKEAVEDAEERVEELLDRGREKLDQVKASVKRSLRSEDDRRPT
jgi:ElaB/YqjD/DUF883 family membrane-anchored ribosome-binding protein